MQALVLGRFQPLHVGHVDLFKQLAEMNTSEILVGICTRPKDEDNPLSYKIRKRMVENVLGDADYAIHEIPDINDSDNYEKHVAGIIKGFDAETVVVTGNKYTAGCFKGHKIKSQKRRINVCGTSVREAISNGKNWKRYIPECNWGIFEKCGLTAEMKMKKLKEETLKTEVVFRGNYITKVEIRAVRLENGKQAIREIVTVPSAVAVLPVTKDGHAVMVRQFMSAIKREVLEIPAGVIDKGESPIGAAKRELLEEVGLKGKLTKICEYNPSAGFCNYTMHVFYALVSEGVVAPDLDDDEVMTMVKMPVEEAYSMVVDGKITDAKSQIAIRHYFNEVCPNEHLQHKKEL